MEHDRCIKMPSNTNFWRYSMFLCKIPVLKNCSCTSCALEWRRVDIFLFRILWRNVCLLKHSSQLKEKSYLFQVSMDVRLSLCGPSSGVFSMSVLFGQPLGYVILRHGTLYAVFRLCRNGKQGIGRRETLLTVRCRSPRECTSWTWRRVVWKLTWR